MIKELSSLSDLILEVVQLDSWAIEQKLSEYRKLLHLYNELKDAGQILFGRISDISGTTFKETYQKYSMDLSD